MPQALESLCCNLGKRPLRKAAATLAADSARSWQDRRCRRKAAGATKTGHPLTLGGMLRHYKEIHTLARPKMPAKVRRRYKDGTPRSPWA